MTEVHTASYKRSPEDEWAFSGIACPKESLRWAWENFVKSNGPAHGTQYHAVRFHPVGCADCNSGTASEIDSRGVARCFECHELWERLRHALMPWTQDEVEAIKVALSHIADDGDPVPVTAAQRKLATEILGRAERHGE